MNYKDDIIEQIYNILDGKIEKENIIVEKPKDRKMADYAIPCFSFSKILRKSPIVIAEELKDKIEGYEKVEVVNGYLNIFLKKKDTIKEIVKDIIEKKDSYGNKKTKNKNIVIEYSSPNIAKPFGVGHLRSTVIGEALKNISIKNGYNVITINYLGDYGTQFGKLIYAYLQWGNKDAMKENPIDELRRVYVKFHEEAEKNPSLDEEGRKWFKRLEDNDEYSLKLWTQFKEASLKEFEKTYNLLGINNFDSYTGEAYYKDKMQPVIDELEAKNLLEISEGATIVRLDDNIVPALIKRSDGGSLYVTRDLAAVFDRKNNYKFDKALYVVGNEQTLHFEQLKKIVEKMGYDFYNDICHINFGLVLQNGKKMSTRQGRSVKLHDVLVETIDLAYKYIDEKNPTLDNKDEIAQIVGVGAVIFNDLKNYRCNDIEFNIEDILRFEGNTGPYIQYTYARIMSLLEHKKNIKLDYEKLVINEYEWNIIFKLYEFNDAIEAAYENFDPSIIAKLLLDIAQDFNKMYANVKIISDDANNTEFVLSICEATSIIIKEGMRLLGIKVINKM
ncbi:MAG TPA: arginine--tRNA ligase [Tenericutes bacterium]|nr:arginine--tRNA ligase [Mycoplasmatota bacterium]